MRFKKKVVIVTGAGSGIGRETAISFAKEGAMISLNDINLESIEKVAKEIRSLNTESIILHGDATNEQRVEEMVKKTIRKFGKIDILVNNVGRFSYRKPIVEIDTKEWDEDMAINVKSVFLWSKYVGQYMIKRRYGKIINISSGAGKIGTTKAGAYGTTKHAVIGITRCLALELIPYNITVNAVCPGYIETPMGKKFAEDIAKVENLDLKEVIKGQIRDIPLGRKANPKEVAMAILFLASDDASYITGESLNITGGQVMH